MINFKFDIAGKIIKASLPESWDEITVKQYQALNFKEWDRSDIVELISRLTGIDVSDLYETPSKPLNIVYTALDLFTKTPPEWKEIKHKPQIELWGKTINIPKDLENESFGIWSQFQVLAEAGDIVRICAMYLQPVLYGKIDPDQVGYVEQSIMNKPAIEILPIITFFFWNVNEFLIYGICDLMIYRRPASKNLMSNFINKLRGRLN